MKQRGGGWNKGEGGKGEQAEAWGGRTTSLLTALYFQLSPRVLPSAIFDDTGVLGWKLIGWLTSATFLKQKKHFWCEKAERKTSEQKQNSNLLLRWNETIG